MVPVEQCPALNLEGIKLQPWALCPQALAWRGCFSWIVEGEQSQWSNKNQMSFEAEAGKATGMSTEPSAHGGSGSCREE